MKLLGVKNDKIVLASISRYDYRSEDDLMVDGGQLNTQTYGGYNRMRGNTCWFEIPQTYADLYNDYTYNKDRKFGKWNLEDVRILPEEEWGVESFEELVKNTIWGTKGIDGDQPTSYVLLMDCDTEHLEAIRHICQERRNDEYVKYIDYILKKRKENEL